MKNYKKAVKVACAGAVIGLIGMVHSTNSSEYFALWACISGVAIVVLMSAAVSFCETADGEDDTEV